MQCYGVLTNDGQGGRVSEVSVEGTMEMLWGSYSKTGVQRLEIQLSVRIFAN